MKSAAKYKAYLVSYDLREKESRKSASYNTTVEHYRRLDGIISGLALRGTAQKRLETLWLIACLYESAEELKAKIVDLANGDKRLFGKAYHRNYQTLMVVARVNDDDFDVGGTKLMRQ